MAEAKPLTVYVHKAQGFGPKHPIPTLMIMAEKTIPESMELEEQRLFAESEANEFVKALLTVLPGCTVEQILIALLKAKASQYRVPITS